MSESSELSRRLVQFTIKRGDVQYEENDQSFLGKGSYGKVYRGRYRRQDVAVKKFHRIFFELAGEAAQEGVIAELTKECELLSCLRHDNVVRLYGIVNSGSPQMCMVTELMDGSLDKLYPASPPLTRCDEADIAWGVSNALLYLHSYRPNPIIHRDLAPKNILYKEDGERYLVKLADVGMAKVVETSRLTSRVAGSVCPGTQSYMPPEALVTRGRPRYGPSLDVFSFGVSMVEVIVCNPPSVLQTQRAADLEEVGERGHPFHGLLKQCLSENPPERPTAARLVEILNGLRSQDWYGTMSSEQHAAHVRWEKSSVERPWRNEYYKMMEGCIAQLKVENRSLNNRQAQLNGLLEQQTAEITACRARTDELQEQLDKANRLTGEHLSPISRRDSQREQQVWGPLSSHSDNLFPDDEEEEASAMAENVWQKLPSLPVKITQECASVIWHDQLYVAAPTTDDGLSSRQHCYNIQLCRLSHDFNSWQVFNVPSPPAKATWPAALHVDTKRGQLLMHTVATLQLSREMFDLHDKIWLFDDCSNKWKLLSSIPNVSGSGTALQEDVIIAAGGALQSESTSSKSTEVQVFDIRTNKWSSWPHLPVPNREARLAPLQHDLLCLGGNHDTRVLTIDRRHPVAWAEHSSSPLHSTCLPGVTVNNNTLFVVGGLDQKFRRAKIECRMWMSTNGWLKLQDLPGGIIVPCVSFHSKQLFAVGGCPDRSMQHFSDEAYLLQM